MSRPPLFNQINPDQAIAVCTREQAEQLVKYDLQRVLVSERAGLLLTAAWMPIAEHVGPFVMTVVFHHTESHPPVLDEIQTLVNTLNFQIRGQPR
jgi:hypothetical protein